MEKKEDRREQVNKPRTKVVVRNLPPFLSEGDFLLSIERWSQQTDYFHYVRGKSDNKKTISSFAFINFKSPEDLVAFTGAFAGHIFVDAKGTEYQATIEYAAHQRLPSPKSDDDQAGTLESDPEYLEFVESLKKEVGPLPSAEVQLEQRLSQEKELLEKHGGKKPAIMSPLLHELLEKKRQRQTQMSLSRAMKRESRSERRRRQKDKDSDTQPRRIEPVSDSPAKRGAKKRDRNRRKGPDEDSKGPIDSLTGNTPSQKQGRRSNRTGPQAKRTASKEGGNVWMAILKDAKRDMQQGEVSILQKNADTNKPHDNDTEPTVYKNFME